jgi:hypothetical protein
MTNHRAKSIAADLRALAGRQVPNLLEAAADELDRLSAFESAFFSMMEIVRAYAKANGELDAASRLTEHHAKH